MSREACHAKRMRRVVPVIQNTLCLRLLTGFFFSSSPVSISSSGVSFKGEPQRRQDSSVEKLTSPQFKHLLLLIGENARVRDARLHRNACPAFQKLSVAGLALV